MWHRLSSLWIGPEARRLWRAVQGGHTERDAAYGDVRRLENLRHIGF